MPVRVKQNNVSIGVSRKETKDDWWENTCVGVPVSLLPAVAAFLQEFHDGGG